MGNSGYCNFEKKLGFEIGKNLSKLNAVKNQKDLDNFVNSIDRNALDTEAKDYLDRVIEGFKHQSFEKNFKQIYNIYLAGLGLKVIR